MTVRQASLSDLKEIEKIEKDNFSPEEFGLSRSSLRYHLKRNIVFVAEDENGIIGYCLWLSRKNFYRLYSIAVLRKFHSKGYAKKLLEHSLYNLKDKALRLEVKQTNGQAISLYEKFGFKIIKILKSYYPNNMDGYLMKRAIS
ncbi:N-acetyltransferase [Sulfurimonas sp. HSL-1716]|uniref:GNAT family N-acetyltransferase n=1 Tax=Hydrocurvibacter sulfurireducens TaxID=3131937 RepID=UPI0031F9CB78